ncbi:MAG: DUF2812 domain-containing protein [Oscillospiraceae bacterium]|jgi:hypothetical protein|nr:DUF2812 domain-containing protein [Oscillospiraceae bacterium]
MNTIKMHKVFFLWDFKREEKWLEAMSRRGLKLRDVGAFTYFFESGAPKERIYRLQMLDVWPASAAGRQYIQFVEDTGVECVGTIMRWVYFCKDAEDGPFEIFSDAASGLSHVTRMLVIACCAASGSLSVGISRLIGLIIGDPFIDLGTTLLIWAMDVLLGYGIFRLARMRSQMKREARLRE